MTAQSGDHSGSTPASPPSRVERSSRSSRSERSRGSTACVSGSPKRQLNSSTFGPRLGDHQARVEDAVVGRPAPAHLVHDRLVHGARERLRVPVVEARHGRVAAHAAGVRALVALADPLVVLRGRQRDRALAVAQREQRELLALEELLEHDLGRAEAAVVEERLERRARVVLGLADDHALARGEHVRLQHDRVVGVREVRLGLLARPERRRAPAVGTPTSFISSFANAFEPSSRAAAAVGPKPVMPLSRERVDHAVDERRLGADDDQVAALVGGRRARSRRRPRPSASMHLIRSLAMPALPGAAMTSGFCGLRSSARTIACSRPPPPTTRTLRAALKAGR